ncbi:MAG: short-chain dehydrogenase/reductase [Paenibacillaceae bacterium]|jgi:short-subunit dehydrogenase|nr:short-chain dehydrogenase/reductase [Paenibacillaceae bacterium]
MGKRIAIVTGATGGIGKEFTRLMRQEEVDEIWAIGRNKEKLASLIQEFGSKVVAMSKDLSDRTELSSIQERLEAEQPIIAYLINNAGVARMGSYQDFTADEIEATIWINCSALAVLCTMCIPYMRSGSRILNISSQASFQPLPYLNLYGATKVFERSYSRALNTELEGTGITSTAVCPGWVDTELLMKEVNGVKAKFPGLVTADRVAEQALKDAKRGKDMSVCTWYVKGSHVMSKLLPQKLIMRMWKRKIKSYIMNTILAER